MIMKSVKIKQILVTGLIGCLAFFNNGCEYVQIMPVEPEGEISYSLDIQPFFNSKCISCHAGNIPPNLEATVSYDELVADNYINTSNPQNSLLYTKINVGGSMETYVSNTEKALLLKWIEQGAKNN